jgi:hypothetical protein
MRHLPDGNIAAVDGGPRLWNTRLEVQEPEPPVLPDVPQAHLEVLHTERSCFTINPDKNDKSEIFNTKDIDHFLISRGRIGQIRSAREWYIWYI